MKMFHKRGGAPTPVRGVSGPWSARVTSTPSMTGAGRPRNDFHHASRGTSLGCVLGKDYAAQNCSVARALEVVGERWTLPIMRDAFLGVTRFDRFVRRLGIGESTLTRRLHTLCAAGVLERSPYRANRFDYLLTERGRDLFPVVHGLMTWGDAHVAPDGPPALTRHLDCGGDVVAGARCVTCDRVVRSDEVEWLWGPGTGREPTRFAPRPPRPAPVTGG